MKNVLFTGPAGAGKTTLVKKAVRRLGDRAGGFYLEEAGRDLRLKTLDGRDAPADPAALDELAVPAVEAALAAGRVVVLDEIGLLALSSEALAAAIQKALDSGSTVVGSLGEQANPVLDAIRARRDTLILPVTTANRDTLLDRVWSGLHLPTESLADAERAVQRQRERAGRYAADHRLRLSGLTAEVRGDHGRYQVVLQGGQWHCSCSFFLKYGTCSHSMAAEESLRPWLEGEEATRGV